MSCFKSSFFKRWDVAIVDLVWKTSFSALSVFVWAATCRTWTTQFSMSLAFTKPKEWRLHKWRTRLFIKPFFAIVGACHLTNKSATLPMWHSPMAILLLVKKENHIKINSFRGNINTSYLFFIRWRFHNLAISFSPGLTSVNSSICWKLKRKNIKMQKCLLSIYHTAMFLWMFQSV